MGSTFGKSRRFELSCRPRVSWRQLLLALLVWLVCLDAFAGAYKDAGMQLSIPEGFEGPVSRAEQGATVAAFVKKYPGDDRGTLLQITTYDFGSALEGMPEDARQDATDRYLAQFLAGVERARQSFRVVRQGPVLLDGIKAARAEWEGDAKGRPMSGVMYCVIVGTRVVVFHTQDFRDAPPGNRKAALDAINAVCFAKR